MGIIMQNSKQLSVPGSSPRLWILNPDASQALYDCLKNSDKYCYVPYVFRAASGRSAGTFKVNGKSTFNGNSICCIQRNGTEVGGAIFAIKIPKRIYKKLYVEVEVTSATYTGWMKAYVSFCKSINMHTDGYPNDVFPGTKVTLVDDAATSEVINSQPGVKINSTDPLLLSAQTVEIDIPNTVDQDFYVGFYNCDRTITFRSIYLE